ncbi:TPA: hypothetical protein PMB18_003773 [Vibrio cholerae]|nr:hypothetical protein [Vibrio cholerae]HDI3138745.1 hypothetical protein [Vibrio cholerae]
MLTEFKLLVHESTASKYQDLFVKIMTYYDEHFQSVKAYGNLGDRGNDGWNPEFGRYYQVYAPENFPKNTMEATNKLKDDFVKLKNYWNEISEIKEYYFVVNDKFSGIPPHLTKAIKQIEQENNLIKGAVVSSSDLERIFFKLDEEFKKQIVKVENYELQKWQLFNLYVNVYDAKCYFNEFRTNELAPFIYNEKVVMGSKGILKNALVNVSNLGCDLIDVEVGLKDIYDNFDLISFYDKELKCFEVLNRIEMKFPQYKKLLSLASSYSELIVYSALGSDYSVQLKNYESALQNIFKGVDEHIDNILKQVGGNTKYVLGKGDAMDDPNYKLLLSMYPRLKYLVGSI